MLLAPLHADAAAAAFSAAAGECARSAAGERQEERERKKESEEINKEREWGERENERALVYCHRKNARWRHVRDGLYRYEIHCSRCDTACQQTFVACNSHYLVRTNICSTVDFDTCSLVGMVDQYGINLIMRLPCDLENL